LDEAARGIGGGAQLASSCGRHESPIPLAPWYAQELTGSSGPRIACNTNIQLIPKKILE
jgi:hypothetical protein